MRRSLVLIWSLLLDGSHLIWHRSVGSILARGGSLGSRRHLGLRGGILARSDAYAESAHPKRRSIQVVEDPRVAPMVCKEKPNHSIFPNRVPQEKARTQRSSCWLSRSFILEDCRSNENDSNQQVLLPRKELPVSGSRFLKHPSFSRSAPHSLRIPSIVAGFWRSAMRRSFS